MYLIKRLGGLPDAGKKFEAFCGAFLVVQHDFRAVYPINTLSSDQKNSLLLPNKDVGIDLVAYAACNRPFAIQCKFRTKRDITWKEFATFDSLCMRTGPWGGKYLMTTAKKVGFYGMILPQEQFVTHKDFDRMTKKDIDKILDLGK